MPSADNVIYVDSVGIPPAPQTNLYQYVDSVGKVHLEPNLYMYVQNNSINRIDPSGLEWRNGSYHYTNDELKVLEEEVGRVGESMAEVAEIQDAIEKGILIDILKQ